MKAYKVPVSTLVVVYTPELEVLLMERADYPGFWQSVTGSQEPGETLAQTARRELLEETGLDAASYGDVRDWDMQATYEIYARYRHRYPPEVTHNVEHWFGLPVPERVPVRLAVREHTDLVWLPWREAAAKAGSWSNRDAILALPGQARRGR